jgi:hypothetical protein
VTLDAALFVAIFVASRPAWTGVGLHEWLAGLLVLPALYHLIINWDWVMNIGPRLVAKLRTTSGINFAIDVALFLALIAVSVSGIMLIPGVLGEETGPGMFSVWLKTHQIASDLTIVAMLAHFVMHASWLSDAFTSRGYLGKPGRHAPGRAPRPHTDPYGRPEELG